MEYSTRLLNKDFIKADSALNASDYTQVTKILSEDFS